MGNLRGITPSLACDGMGRARKRIVWVWDAFGEGERRRTEELRERGEIAWGRLTGVFVRRDGRLALPPPRF